MKEIILSHDSEAYLYSVPEAVAKSPHKYVTKFDKWMQTDPAAEKLFIYVQGKRIASFGAQDFIDYLNNVVFPDQPCRLVRALDCWYGDLPKEYRHHSQFNF